MGVRVYTDAWVSNIHWWSLCMYGAMFTSWGVCGEARMGAGRSVSVTQCQRRSKRARRIKWRWEIRRSAEECHSDILVMTPIVGRKNRQWLFYHQREKRKASRQTESKEQPEGSGRLQSTSCLHFIVTLFTLCRKYLLRFQFQFKLLHETSPDLTPGTLPIHTYAHAHTPESSLLCALKRPVRTSITTR